MKILSVLLVVLFLSLIIICSGSAAGIDIKEGLWSVTAKTEIPGMPFPLPPITNSQCLSRDDLIPKGKDRDGQECNLVEQQVGSNSVSWIMNCADGGSVSTSTGKITYRGETFAGKVNVSSAKSGRGGEMNITTVMTGKYIGECN